MVPTWQANIVTREERVEAVVDDLRDNLESLQPVLAIIKTGRDSRGERDCRNLITVGTRTCVSNDTAEDNDHAHTD